MTISLAEELVLLAYRDDGVATKSTYLDYGIAGALLLDLALAERITLDDKRVRVISTAPVGNPVVDAALEKIAGDAKQRKPKDWVSRLARKARPPVLDALVGAGILERREGTVLLIFPRTVYPAPLGVEPPIETDARQRMRAALTGTGPVAPRTAALCTLAAALGWEKQAFGDDLPRAEVKRRLAELREGEWAGEAVKKAITDLQAAMTAAMMAGSVAAAGSS